LFHFGAAFFIGVPAFVLKSEVEVTRIRTKIDKDELKIKKINLK